MSNDLARELGPSPTSTLGLRQAVVQSTATGPARVTIRLGGGAIDVTARYLASYTPTVADVVWVLVAGADLIVLGKLAA